MPIAFSRFQLFSSILFVVLLASVCVLFYLFFFQFKGSQSNQSELLPQPTPNPTFETKASNDPSTQLANLEASVSALTTRIELLEQVSQKNVAPGSPSEQSSAAKKETLYLGEAATQNLEWQDTGLEVVINADDYPSTTNVWYEAGMSIVGGQAWSRLKNKSTGAIINASEVYEIGNTTTWISSGSFKLHPGTNRYIVQLRSTSGETANLAGARVILSW